MRVFVWEMMGGWGDIEDEDEKGAHYTSAVASSAARTDVSGVVEVCVCYMEQSYLLVKNSTSITLCTVGIHMCIYCY